MPIIIAVGGTLLALLSAALLHSLTTSRERAIELAHGMTAELRARERELARSNEELEHFAYLASHDLQEPLRTIRSYTGLLERRLGDRLDAKERSWFGYITTGAGHMSELIADLLEYSRAGISRGDLEAVDLAEAWGDAERRLASAISESGAHVERAPLPVVAGRRGELVSLLQNLLANAIKYRRPGVAPVVKVEASRQRDVWEVRVTDNGIGIDPRFHDRVFGLFQRLHSSDEYPGTGMGLAIVRKLAEANGGAVHVESAAGGGTAVVVALRDWEATT